MSLSAPEWKEATKVDDRKPRKKKKEKDIPLRTGLSLRNKPRRQRPHLPVDKLWAVVEAHARVTGSGDAGPAVLAVEVAVVGYDAHFSFFLGCILLFVAWLSRGGGI